VIDRLISNHPRLTLALSVIIILVECMLFRVESQDMRIFVVSSLIFVSVFFASGSKDSLGLWN